MDITDMYVMKALAFRLLLAGQCMDSRCYRQIIEAVETMKRTCMVKDGQISSK